MFSHPLLGHGLNFFSPWSIGSRRQLIHPDGSNDLEWPWNSRREEHFFRRISVRTLVPFDTLRPKLEWGHIWGHIWPGTPGLAFQKFGTAYICAQIIRETNQILHGDQTVWNDLCTRPNMPPALAIFLGETNAHPWSVG